jgi:hypothetical protein
MSAQVYDGRRLAVDVYYRPGKAERPYHLEAHFYNASWSDHSHARWNARAGQVLRGDMKLFFFSQECLALNDLDAFAREQGFPGLKPPPPSA